MRARRDQVTLVTRGTDLQCYLNSNRKSLVDFRMGCALI
jgi:hypothetical protein